MKPLSRTFTRLVYAFEAAYYAAAKANTATIFANTLKGVDIQNRLIVLERLVDQASDRVTAAERLFTRMAQGKLRMTSARLRAVNTMLERVQKICQESTRQYRMLKRDSLKLFRTHSQEARSVAAPRGVTLAARRSCGRHPK